MAAGLKRYVQRRSACPHARNPQGFNLGMRLPEAAMPAFAHDFGAARNHAANHRVRLDKALPLGRQFQGPLHVPTIEEGLVQIRGPGEPNPKYEARNPNQIQRPNVKGSRQS